jgi:predicted nucleic acid-binding protein
LIGSVRVLGVNKDTIVSAIESGMTDFEDAVQAAAARDVDVDIIVTRDKDGFHNSGLQVYSPEEFLETLKH